MISALAFSRDRPAQLDLLLTSLRERAPSLHQKTRALWTASTPGYEQAYEICRSYHPEVIFIREHKPDGFHEQIIESLTASDGDYASLFCDDDVLIRPLDQTPETLLGADPQLLNFSLRLGGGTVECYPLHCKQRLPQFIASGRTMVWDWCGNLSEHDWAYRGSVDGTIWRRDQLLTLIRGSRWSSPNELEDALNRACQTALLPFGACYRDQRLVGVPVNSVQSVYDPNRHSDTHRAPLHVLNREFLKGRRLSLESVILDQVHAAHAEFRLLWEQEDQAALVS